jgi:hypothetical protein
MKTAMFDFLRRRRLSGAGLLQKKRGVVASQRIAAQSRVCILRSVSILLPLLGWYLIFSGQQPEPTKNFVIALLFFATAIVQL